MSEEKRPPVFEWVAVQACTLHPDCVADPIVGIRCFARNDRPEIHTLADWDKHWTDSEKGPNTVLLPFKPDEVKPGESMIFFLSSQIYCVPLRLRVPSIVGVHFLIESFQLGNMEYIYPGPISALAYAEHAWPSIGSFQAMRTGTGAALRAKNTHHEPQTFSAWLEVVPSEAPDQPRPSDYFPFGRNE